MFEEADLIHCYACADAVEDGMLMCGSPLTNAASADPPDGSGDREEGG
jgi:hypothetical protein